MLYLAAEADDNAGFDFSQDAEAMHSATKSADKQLEVLRGPLHGIALMAGSERARSVVEAFLKDGTEPRRQLGAAAWVCASHRGR